MPRKKILFEGETAGASVRLEEIEPDAAGADNADAGAPSGISPERALELLGLAPATLAVAGAAAPQPALAAVRPTLTGDTLGGSSEYWRGLIPEIEVQRQALSAERETLLNRSEIIELAEARGLEGAAEEVAEHREALRRNEIAIDGKLRAAKRAEAELHAAEQREAAADRQKRVERAQALCQDYVAACAKFDALLGPVAASAADIRSIARRLRGYNDVTKFDDAAGIGIAHNERLIAIKAQAAVWHAGAELAELLDLTRDRPIVKMEALAEAEVRRLSRFAPSVSVPRIEIAPDSDGKPAPDAPVSDPTTLGIHGAIVLASLKTGGKTYLADDFIPPEIVMSWPLPNRMALASTERVRYLTEPYEPAPADAVDAAEAISEILS